MADQQTLPEAAEKRFWQGVADAERFFMGEAQVQKALEKLARAGYPGDGRPKPVAFPDPAVATRGARVSLLPLATLIELKLASGMTAPHRLKDLADVLELIRTLNLPEGLSDSLHEYVRAKYLELWQAAQTRDPED